VRIREEGFWNQERNYLGEAGLQILSPAPNVQVPSERLRERERAGLGKESGKRIMPRRVIKNYRFEERGRKDTTEGKERNRYEEIDYSSWVPKYL